MLTNSTKERPASSWANAAVQNEIQFISSAPTRGQARKRLLRASASLYEIQAAHLVSEDYLVGELTVAGLGQDFKLSEVNKCISWGKKKGQVRPRSPKAFTEPKTRTDRRADILGWINIIQDDPNLKPTTKKFAHSLANKAIELAKTKISFSYRQLAEENNMSHMGAARHAKKLDRYLIQHTGDRVRGTSTVWQLALDGKPLTGMSKFVTGRRPTSSAEAEVSQNLTSDGNLPNPGVVPEFGHRELLDPGHNLWHRRPNAWAIYGVLTEGGSHTAASLSRTLGICRQTVKSNLDFLAKVALVLQDFEGEWEIVETFIGDAEEKDLGIEDYRTKREHKHQEQRRHWKTWTQNLFRARAVAERRTSHKEAAWQEQRARSPRQERSARSAPLL